MGDSLHLHRSTWDRWHPAPLLWVQEQGAWHGRYPYWLPRGRSRPGDSRAVPQQGAAAILGPQRLGQAGDCSEVQSRVLPTGEGPGALAPTPTRCPPPPGAERRLLRQRKHGCLGVSKAGVHRGA